MINNLGIIFLSAGSSRRFNGDKLLELLDSKPLFMHSIISLYPLVPEENVVIVVREEKLEKFKEIVKEEIPNNKFTFILGGKERYHSVYNGLLALSNNNAIEYAAIHDTARPFVNKKIFMLCLDYAKKYGSGIPGKRLTDTIKRSDRLGKIVSTINRNNLWAVETPQIFEFLDIFSSYKKVIMDRVEITDDASAMEYCNKEVYIVENPYPNKKITYRSDIME